MTEVLYLESHIKTVAQVLNWQDRHFEGTVLYISLILFFEEKLVKFGIKSRLKLQYQRIAASLIKTHAVESQRYIRDLAQDQRKKARNK
jgi:hypothetical protein